MTFALGIGALTFGLGQGTTWGWTSAKTLGTVAIGLASLVAFVLIDRHKDDPLIRLSLFRHKNFAAANISQVLAGMVELGSAFLLPYFLLLTVGLSPGAAGLALIPATIPIIIVAPLAGRWFDKVGGRVPLVVGFLVLAASGFALAIGFGQESVVGLVPGLVLQGIGLGIVLTVNDPTGINAVPEDVRGQASGVIDTSEQFGGAIGIAVMTALFLQYYLSRFFDLLVDRGIHPTASQNDRAAEYVMRAEQEGLDQVRPPKFLGDVFGDFHDAHVAGYRFVFVLAGIMALVGAAVAFFLVRRDDRTFGTTASSRAASRWVWASSGVGPGLTRKEEPAGDADAAGRLGRGALVEGAHLGLRQRPPRARRQADVGERADAGADESHDGVADRLAHPAHDPVATLVDDDLDRGRVAGATRLDDPGLGGRGAPVVEVDALAQGSDRGGRRGALDLGQVLLVDAVARVGEQVRELAVVREHEEALGVVVEAPDREHPRVVGHEIEDGAPALGIVRGRHHLPGLVEQVVDEIGAHDRAARRRRRSRRGRGRRAGPAVRPRR